MIFSIFTVAPLSAPQSPPRSTSQAVPVPRAELITGTANEPAAEPTSISPPKPSLKPAHPTLQMPQASFFASHTHKQINSSKPQEVGLEIAFNCLESARPPPHMHMRGMGPGWVTPLCPTSINVHEKYGPNLGHHVLLRHFFAQCDKCSGTLDVGCRFCALWDVG